MYRYLLITAAFNEEEHIEKTIRSVVSQTIRPEKWFIVSDGSTDRTDAIVKEYVLKNEWIELLHMPEHSDRQFAAKVRCFNAAYKTARAVEYDVIGNLDADISFGREYFEFLLERFERNPRLGVAGTPFVEGNFRYDYRFASIEHVSGACQLFRRECFEEIGGYVGIKSGGIDWVAVTTARMKGWETRTFTEKVCYHHREIGTGDGGALVARFKQGKKDYYLGGHPLWEILRASYQMGKKPYVLGGGVLLWGYIWGFLSRVERPVSGELIEFHRREQMRRLKSILVNRKD
jgi:poly-beta-1,6-N-acetyl-D-glucosamine synthase